jgi:hypothetical protein
MNKNVPSLSLLPNVVELNYFLYSTSWDLEEGEGSEGEGREWRESEGEGRKGREWRESEGRKR